MKKALVLAGGIAQIKLIRDLQERGYFVILADYTKEPIAAAYADKFYRESTLDVDAIRKIAISEKVDLVTTCCTDQALATVSLISQELDLPCYVSAELGLAVTNKMYMKRTFAKNSIPTAEFVVVDNCNETVDLEFPLVVKPVDCNSSKGVKKVNNTTELKEAIQKAIDFSRTRTAIVERFVEGQEISVDVFVQDGVATVLCKSRTDKVKHGDGFIINRGWYPAGVSQVADRKINETVQRIVDAFGIKNGPMLVQLLNQGDDINIIEFSARTGGCIKYRLIELASSVDVIRAMLDVLEGKKVNLAVVPSEKLVINEFIYTTNGIFSHVEGIEICKENGWIENGYVLKSANTEMGTVASSGDRIVAVTYVVDSEEEYEQMHRNVCDTIQILDCDGNDITMRGIL